MMKGKIFAVLPFDIYSQDLINTKLLHLW